MGVTNQNGSKAAREAIRVCVTGAAGQIAYSLLFALGRGDVFGLDQPIVLQLLDIPTMMDVLEGVVMELNDSMFSLVQDVVASDDPMVAFKDCDCAFLIGAMPRREGMERKDLLAANAKIFQAQGQALEAAAKKTVKVLVVGNPANTNALITSHYAPSIPKEQFTSLTHLDQNRAKGFIARRVGVSPSQVKNIIIWGNHSATQYPDIEHAYIENPDGTRVTVREAVSDDAWLHGEFVKSVQVRGAAVIKARKLSSAMSAAKAIVDHMRVWWMGTPKDEITSMGVISDGSYGVKPGVVYSMPVTITDGKISIVQGLAINDFSRQMMDETCDELIKEREAASQFLQPVN